MRVFHFTYKREPGGRRRQRQCGRYQFQWLRLDCGKQRILDNGNERKQRKRQWNTVAANTGPVRTGTLTIEVIAKPSGFAGLRT